MPSEKAQKIAAAACRKILGGKIISIKSSDKVNPHFAKILIRNFAGNNIAIIAGLQNESAENLLSLAFIWAKELGAKSNVPAGQIWIISGEAKKLNAICGALKDEWRRRISIFDSGLKEVNEGARALKKLSLPKKKKMPRQAESILGLSEDIQMIGNYFNFRGLNFARISKGDIYFGIEGQDQLLRPENWNELSSLINSLSLYRAHNSPNRRHIFYKLYPESWLESILRKDISCIDRHLILSPLHAQFKASSDQIDLLAIRKDGRLVVIEIKISPNKEHLFQAIDYWQEIEKQRLAGNLKGLFGKHEISDQNALIYLVAPHSAYHHDFGYMADAISEEIEIYRFDLNENWRRDIAIIDKSRLSGKNIENKALT